MIFSSANLLLSLLTSSIGMGYFHLRKKQARYSPMACGFILMLYPYFVENIIINAAIGMVLIVLPFFIAE